MMKLATALVTLLMLLLTSPGVPHADTVTSVPLAAGVLAGHAVPGIPEATKKPTAKASPSASPSPSPSVRRPVDEEGDRWVNLAVIAGSGLMGTVVAFLIAGALLRRRGRRRQSD